MFTITLRIITVFISIFGIFMYNTFIPVIVINLIGNFIRYLTNSLTYIYTSRE